MINREKIVENFLELVKIDSLTLKERQMADALKLKLEAMGLEVFEDGAGKKIGGNAGNLICTLKGTKSKSSVPPILFNAHMDTVSPGIGKKPILKDDIIYSDGTTILGADDVAGIVCILEAVRVLIKNKIEHGDINIVFTVSEENRLQGAKNLDYTKIKAKYAFVLDGGVKAGCMCVKGITHQGVVVDVKGKASHAGVNPENGINAIQIASVAIGNMKLGRIDEETTANIGIINGGVATNIICDHLSIRGEVRSHNNEKVEAQVEHMRKCFEDAASAIGGEVDFTTITNYHRFSINQNHKIVEIAKNAAKNTGIPLEFIIANGGSDANVMNYEGIPTVVLKCGSSNPHSLNESVDIREMVKCAQFLVEIAKAIES